MATFADENDGGSRTSAGTTFSAPFAQMAQQVRSAGTQTARAIGNSSKKKKSSGKSSGSGVRSSGYRSPIGSNSSGTIAKTSAPPKMTQAQFLASDTVYKGQQAAYQKALQDYLAQYQAEQNKYNTEYGVAVDKLGLERGEGLNDLKDDYASRGLLNSGVYAGALNDLNTKFDSRLGDMERGKATYLQDLLTGKTNFEEEQKLAAQKAQQDAINRFLSGMGG